MSAIYCQNGEVIVCDDGRHDILNEKGEKMDPDDAVLAKVVADAVCKALDSHRKARDARKGRDDNLSPLESKNALESRQRDHRQDFSSLAAIDSALAGGYEFARLSDSAGLDLDALFAAPAQVES